MGRAVRAELMKFFTTRLWWGMAVGIFLAGAVFALLFGFLLTSESAGEGGPGGVPTGDETQIASSVYTAGISVGYLLMLAIGVISIGSEYRHHTISATFLVQPRRWRVMGAKMVSLLLIGALYGVLSLVGSVAAGAIALTLNDADPFPSTEILRTLALSLLVLGLWALIGLGIGILIPNQIAALMIGVGVAWVVEPIAGLLLRSWDFGNDYIAKFMPTEATNAVLDAVQNSPDAVRLEWWAGALTLAAYAAVLAGVGSLLTTRRDVS